VVRTRNVINALIMMHMSISPDSITSVYLKSERLKFHPKVSSLNFTSI
jgi:hypothetical protein